MNIQRLANINYSSAFDRVGAWPHHYLWIAFACFVFVAPAIVLRGAHFEEGTVIGLARGAFEDGHWLVPHHYGERFVERPVLFSWLLGAIGAVTGTVPVWLARIPVALALCGGAWLIFYLVRQSASTAAALFGAACFMTSPLVIDKVFTAETDLFVAAIVFAAFVMVWDGSREAAAEPFDGCWSARC